MPAMAGMSIRLESIRSTGVCAEGPRVEVGRISMVAGGSIRVDLCLAALTRGGCYPNYGGNQA